MVIKVTHSGRRCGESDKLAPGPGWKCSDCWLVPLLRSILQSSFPPPSTGEKAIVDEKAGERRAAAIISPVPVSSEVPPLFTKRIARSKPETRARLNTLQRERRALKRQQAINPHDDNIKHTKCVQTPSLYSPSCSRSLKDTFNSSSSVTPSCSHCFMNNTHSDLNDYSHEKQ
ncbi:hypothetical protein CDAR_418651 [Caerostris darwini]|uniref:Uncharacterized protein n=1 Tax=Caerostris darwini TaxID=1538125 RepID=A0AAV4MWH7_9ARAC|nr:hypothetical protein CDAR_418651 [Caerostris darwini]